MVTFWKVKFGTYKTKIPFFDSSQFSLSSLYYVWSCSLLFLLLLLVSLHLSQSFSCFNPRNKNTTAATRFVTLHNQIRLTPSLCYLGFSLSSQPWPNPRAPPPPLVTVGLPFLSLCLYFYFSFLCFWLYLGCLGDWVQFGMWKSFDNLAWVRNLGHLSGCVGRSGKKREYKRTKLKMLLKERKRDLVAMDFERRWQPIEVGSRQLSLRRQWVSVLSFVFFDSFISLFFWGFGDLYRYVVHFPLI